MNTILVEEVGAKILNLLETGTLNKWGIVSCLLKDDYSHKLILDTLTWLEGKNKIITTLYDFKSPDYKLMEHKFTDEDKYVLASKILILIRSGITSEFDLQNNLLVNTCSIKELQKTFLWMEKVGEIIKIIDKTKNYAHISYQLLSPFNDFKIVDKVIKSTIETDNSETITNHIINNCLRNEIVSTKKKEKIMAMIENTKKNDLNEDTKRMVWKEWKPPPWNTETAIYSTKYAIEEKNNLSGNAKDIIEKVEKVEEIAKKFDIIETVANCPVSYYAGVILSVNAKDNLFKLQVLSGRIETTSTSCFQIKKHPTNSLINLRNQLINEEERAIKKEKNKQNSFFNIGDKILCSIKDYPVSGIITNNDNATEGYFVFKTTDSKYHSVPVEYLTLQEPALNYVEEIKNHILKLLESNLKSGISYRFIENEISKIKYTQKDMAIALEQLITSKLILHDPCHGTYKLLAYNKQITVEDKIELKNDKKVVDQAMEIYDFMKDYNEPITWFAIKRYFGLTADSYNEVFLDAHDYLENAGFIEKDNSVIPNLYYISTIKGDVAINDAWGSTCGISSMGSISPYTPDPTITKNEDIPEDLKSNEEWILKNNPSIRESCIMIPTSSHIEPQSSINQSMFIKEISKEKPLLERGEEINNYEAFFLTGKDKNGGT